MKQILDDGGKAVDAGRSKGVGEHKELIAQSHDDGQPRDRQIASRLAQRVMYAENFLPVQESGPQYTPNFSKMQ